MRGLIQEVQLCDSLRMYDNWEEKLRKGVVDYQDKIIANRAMGVLDEPTGKLINLERVSHKINALFWADDKLKANLSVLPTPMGMILNTLLEHNVPVVIRPELSVVADYLVTIHQLEIIQFWIGTQ